jgi:hypothetical protein
MSEKELLEKLRKVERLFAGAATAGERDAAADAMLRIKQRLKEQSDKEREIEYKFTLSDGWSRTLFIALLRRYGLRPYRYARQRRNTVRARVPRRFVDETLWPEFMELSAVLKKYLDDVTRRVIAEAIHADEAEEDVVSGEAERLTD